MEEFHEKLCWVMERRVLHSPQKEKEAERSVAPVASSGLGPFSVTALAGLFKTRETPEQRAKRALILTDLERASKLVAMDAAIMSGIALDEVGCLRGYRWGGGG